VDGAAAERLRIRLDGAPGIKLSIQKQPLANTVGVVERVDGELARLQAQGLVPDDIQVRKVDDQARYVRQQPATTRARPRPSVPCSRCSWSTCSSAASAGTLIIGSAMPIAVLLTFTLMAAFGLDLNIMTLGGLALGIGMLVDSTIVMLENIQRHQRRGEPGVDAAVGAAREVTSAIVASTSTNLAAVLPFLFIGGLIGLLFRELIFTISAAILASMIVALTLVPALAGACRRREGWVRRGFDRGMGGLQAGYGWLLRGCCRCAGCWSRVRRLARLTVPGFFGGRSGVPAEDGRGRRADLALGRRGHQRGTDGRDGAAGGGHCRGAARGGGRVHHRRRLGVRPLAWENQQPRRHPGAAAAAGGARRAHVGGLHRAHAGHGEGGPHPRAQPTSTPAACAASASTAATTT
jgi:hypothetical protein